MWYADTPNSHTMPIRSSSDDGGGDGGTTEATGNVGTSEPEEGVVAGNIFFFFFFSPTECAPYIHTLNHWLPMNIKMHWLAQWTHSQYIELDNFDRRLWPKHKSKQIFAASGHKETEFGLCVFTLLSWNCTRSTNTASQAIRDNGDTHNLRYGQLAPIYWN